MIKNIEITIFAFIILCLTSFGAISQNDSTKINLNFFEAHKAYKNNDYAKAKKIFTHIISKENNDAAYFYLAKIAIFSSDPVEAEIFLKKAIDTDSTNYWYKLQLGQLYIKTNEIDKAINIYEELKAEYPRKYEIYYGIVDLYIHKNETEKALEILTQIEKIAGKDEATGLTRLNLILSSGDATKGYEYIQDLSKEVISPRIFTLVGDMHADRFKDSLAIINYQKALKIEPDYAPAFYGKAEVYRIKQYYDKYFENINLFLASENMYSQTKIEYLSNLMKNVKFISTFMPQVDTMMISLSSSHPQDSIVNNFLSIYYVQTNRIEEGLKIAEQEIIRYPKSFPIRMQYLSILYFANYWERLEVAVSEALKLYPKNITLLQMAAAATWQNKNYQTSIDLYNNILPLAKGDSTMTVNAHYSLGDLYMSMEQPKKAYHHYEKSIKINPNHLPSLNNYAYFLSLENKKLSKAYRMSKITIDVEPNNPTYLDTFAWILHLMGKNQEAKAILKHAMIYGGKDHATIIDHYAEILYALGEYDMAYIYWMQADLKDKNLKIQEKIKKRKSEEKK